VLHFCVRHLPRLGETRSTFLSASCTCGRVPHRARRFHSAARGVPPFPCLAAVSRGISLSRGGLRQPAEPVRQQHSSPFEAQPLSHRRAAWLSYIDSGSAKSHTFLPYPSAVVSYAATVRPRLQEACHHWSADTRSAVPPPAMHPCCSCY